MNEAVNILLVEDSEDDAALTLRALSRGGFETTSRRVYSEQGLRDALRDDRWDAVLADFRMPGFTGLDALAIVRATGLDVPFILVSGTVGEEMAVAAMKAGAHDYIMKKSLARLAPALERELKEAHIRAANRRSGEELAMSESRFRQLFHCTPLPLWVYDLESLRFLDVNDAACRDYGYAREEFLAMTLRDIRPDGDIARMEQHIRESGQGPSSGEIWRHRKKDGSIIEVEIISQSASFQGRGARYVCAIDVTRRLQAEEGIRKLQQAVEQSPVATVITDCEGRIEYVNAKFVSISGYQRDEVMGRTSRIVNSGLTPPEVYAGLWGTIRSGADWRGKLRNRKKSGELYWEDLHISPLKDRKGEIVNFIAVKEDISTRMETEEALRESESRFRQLADSVQEAFFLVDPSGSTMLYMSPAYEQIWGRSCESVYQSPLSWMEPIHPEDREIVQAYMARSTAGPSEVEFRIIRPDGNVRWVRKQRYPVLGDDGNVARIAGIAEDFTARREAEDEVRRVNADLERRVAERTAELEAANRELEAFDYSVAHDLRAPLNRIRGFSDVLLEDFADRLGDSAHDMVRRITTAASVMDQLIADLLSLSTLAKGELQRADVDVSAMAHAVCETLARAQPARQVQCIVSPGMLVRADPGLLRIVLDNLLGNAWKFTALRERACIEAGVVGLAGNSQEFFVRDNGAGFDQAAAPNLFAPFHRLHRGSEFKGTGIGLATVQRIVHRHGGRVRAEGAVDRGATIYFTLVP